MSAENIKPRLLHIYRLTATAFTMACPRAVVQRTCVAFAIRSCRYQSPYLNPTRLFSAGLEQFVPPPPPTSKGIPVFADIDFEQATRDGSEAIKRNADPGSVFVVTGSSRGIGLQFIKSLLVRTKVRQVYLASSCGDKRMHLKSLDIRGQLLPVAVIPMVQAVCKISCRSYPHRKEVGSTWCR